MIKGLSIATRAEKEKFKVPRRVQDVIPVQTIYDDGIFKVGHNKYSKSYKFSDINYTSKSEEEEEAILLKYSALLNSFDPFSTTKLTINKRKLNRVAFEQEMLLPAADDGLNVYRSNVNDVLLKAATDRCAAVKDRIITVSVNKRNVIEAREHFNSVEMELGKHFDELGSSVEALSVDERLRIFHDFYRPEEDVFYHFDIADSRKKGHSFKDYICPDSLEQKDDYFKAGNRFGRVLFLKEYANFIKDRIVSDLTALGDDMMLSIDLISVPVEDAVKEAERRLLGTETNITNWQRKQNQNNNFSATPPYDLVQQKEAIKELLDDLTKRDQKVMQVVLTIVHTAETKEQLDADTKGILQTANKNMVQCGVLRWQQLDGLNTALPFGTRKIDAFRTLTSESLAIFVPFNAREIYQKNGVFYGCNPVNNTMIFADRTKLKNGNEFILGSPGGGKSMTAKWEIVCKKLAGKADIIIIDPEREYGKLVEALGGEVIDISADSENHINPLDINKNYNEGKNPLVLKSQLIMSLCEMISEGEIGADEHSLIDRAVAAVYESYIANDYQGEAPTLQDFRFALLALNEPKAKALALKLELFTTGSLNTFAHETNVDTQNSLICFDILDLGEQLQSVGMLIILDSILNRITQNRAKGRQTFLFIDEIYLLFQHEYSANFLFVLWKRVRKYGAYATGITQNVDDLLQSHTARTMLANSEFVVMLNQASTDRAELAHLFDISPDEMKFITNSKVGRGLLRIEDALVPFENEFPTDTQLYKLMSTKPGEGL